MSNNEILLDFLNQVENSIKKGTFAKLTFSKTIGNTDLMNIYVRAILVNDTINFELTHKFQQETQIEIYTINQSFKVLTPYINNPFMLVILFTTESDVMLKLNKKRDYKITEQQATFKNPAPAIVDFMAI